MEKQFNPKLKCINLMYEDRIYIYIYHVRAYCGPKKSPPPSWPDSSTVGDMHRHCKSQGTIIHSTFKII